MELDHQAELATRMGATHSAISRIESGQHSTSVQTLQRLAAALEMRVVMSFEHDPGDCALDGQVATVDPCQCRSRDQQSSGPSPMT